MASLPLAAIAPTKLNLLDELRAAADTLIPVGGADRWMQRLHYAPHFGQDVLAVADFVDDKTWRQGFFLAPIEDKPARSITPSPVGWRKILERTILELGRLSDGWDGDGGVAPSARLLREMESALRALPSQTAEPEVEVDGSTGGVTLRWWSPQMDNSVSFDFSGNGEVFVVAMGPDGALVPPALVPVHDETRIIEACEALGASQGLLAAA